MTTSGGTSNNSSSASMNQIPNWKDQLLSTDSRARLMGASSFRKLLSTHRDVASIEKVVQQNVIPIFIKFLGSNSSPELQFETAWVLTNVTSSSMEFTMHVIHHGAAAPLISLLRSKNQKVREQALWCLGNIAADFPFHLLHLHVLPPLFELLRANPNSKVLGLASWTLKNLCRNQTDLATVAEIAPALMDLVMQKDIEIFGEACYGFSSLLDAVTYESLVHSLDDKTANRIPDLITRFVELLNLNNGPLVKAILRCLCKIVKSEAENREMAIELGVMGQLKKLLLASNPEIRQEACWAVCSILSGSRDDIQAILDAELIPDLLLLLINSEESEKRVIACAFNNASNTATSAQLKILADKGCILALCNLLSVENNLIKKASLEAIANFLRTAEKTKSYTIYLKGYVTLLQKLKEEGTECSSIASYLIENYLDSKQHGSSNKLIHEFLNENYITLDIIQPEIDESMLSSKIHKRPEENEENMLLISLVASARSILQKAESLSNHYALKSESGRAIDHEKLKELAQIANQLDTQLLPSQQPSNS